MAYYKQMLALVWVCLSVLHHNLIEGMKFVEAEGKQTEAKVCRILSLEFVIWQTQVSINFTHLSNHLSKVIVII